MHPVEIGFSERPEASTSESPSLHPLDTLARREERMSQNIWDEEDY